MLSTAATQPNETHNSAAEKLQNAAVGVPHLGTVSDVDALAEAAAGSLAVARSATADVRAAELVWCWAYHSHCPDTTNNG